MSSAFVHTENHGSWFSTPDGRITLLAPSSPSNLTDGNYGLLKAGIGYSIQIPQEGREALFRSHQFSNTQDNPSALDRPAIRREPGKPASTEIVIINDDTSDSMSTLGTQSPSQACQGQPPEEPILIDLDDIEDKLNIEFPDEEEQVSRIGKPPFDQHGVGKPTRPRMLPPPPMRNPPITAPYIILDHYRHTTAANNIYHLGSSVLVELRHEEFLLIKHIIQNTKTGEIFLRGALLQRSRHMNGVLEHKLCELAFIYEIDLDDPRKAEEQGLVERPACSVLRKRPFHLTNQSWPEDRAVGRDGFKDQALDGIVGPVTVRWKHIIVYPDATSRTKNIRAHRALEHLKEDEIPGSAKIKDTRRRGQWRGLTIPGGSYLPKINNCSGRPIEIRSSSPDTTIDGELPGHRRTSLGRSRAPETIPLEVRMYAHKRKLHSTDFCKSSQERQYPYKRARYNSPDEGERGRRSSRVSMQSSDGDVRERISTMDISNDRPSTPDSLSHPAYDSEVSPRTIPGLKKFSNVTKEQERRVSFLQSDCSPTPSIDISSSELSMPPPFGDIKNTTETRQLICRTPGQKLTYGDAFCGAGGTTRGAVMAGFRVKWGFDEDSAPCGTWRVNFPNAACYQLHSSGFIALAKKNRNLDMKVDILHLSPPCQFFSSAHTVAGVKDEVNLASLFAVHDIIDVARPRIVTLEQTFGITVPKFRAYLNHLIQMFTSHHFSVRWAVVPLAQWVRVLTPASQLNTDSTFFRVFHRVDAA